MSDAVFIGTSKGFAVYKHRSRDKYALIDVKNLTASVYTEKTEIDALLSDRAWDKTENPDPVLAQIASASFRLDHAESTPYPSEPFSRTYTVPKRVQDSAITAMGSTPTSNCTGITEHIATLLSSGNQVSAEDVLWVHRFFQTHSEETTDRPVWLAWGGDEGKRWSSGLASRLDYDSVVADAGSPMFDTPGLAAWVDGDETDRTFWCELSACPPESSEAHSLYKLTPQATWQAWGNGDWVDCDEPQGLSQGRFVELDDEAALYLAGALFDAPDSPVDLRTPNPEAWDLAQAAYGELDHEFLDRLVKPVGIMAAGVVPTPSSPAADGYTPEERSKNASDQLRDANGRFAKTGDTGAVKSTGIGGTITGVNTATKTVTIQTTDGEQQEIAADDFEVGAAPHPKPDPSAVPDLDLEGIVAPLKTDPEPKARLDVVKPILSPFEIKSLLENYSKYITEKRQERSEEFAADDVPEPTPNPTPGNTDVEPLYLAIVDAEDPQAVMDLVALVPATATSNEAATFRRSGGEWVEDQKILQDLRSATPPPVVQLTSDEFKDVLGQVDIETAVPDDANGAVTAAGGADRNRGNAEQLRRYWTVGEGGLKIRWGTGGDWTRCVRLLSKHLGPRAKGYCALRHKEMNGYWPGDKRNKKD